jgi:hypothetical protein
MLLRENALLRPHTDIPTVEMDEETQRNLTALGYLR